MCAGLCMCNCTGLQACTEDSCITPYESAPSEMVHGAGFWSNLFIILA